MTAQAALRGRGLRNDELFIIGKIHINRMKIVAYSRVKRQTENRDRLRKGEQMKRNEILKEK